MPALLLSSSRSRSRGSSANGGSSSASSSPLARLFSPRQPPPPPPLPPLPAVGGGPEAASSYDASCAVVEGEWAEARSSPVDWDDGRGDGPGTAALPADCAVEQGNGVGLMEVGPVLSLPILQQQEEEEEEEGGWVVVSEGSGQQQQFVIQQLPPSHDPVDDDDDASSVLSFSTARGEESESEEEEDEEGVDRWGFVVRLKPQPGADARTSRLSLQRRRSARLLASGGGGGSGSGVESGLSEEERAVLRRWRQEVQKETERAGKWLSMLKSWAAFTRRHPQRTKRRIRKGIPDVVRRQAWGLLLGLPDALRDQPGLYDSLLLSREGQEGGGTGEEREVVDTIERDVGRTFPQHVFFRERNGEGQGRLRRVLRAYARMDPDVGYCQGMGFVAAMLLTYFPEDEAFHVLLILMQGRAQQQTVPFPFPAVRAIYLPGMPKAREMLFVGDRLTQRHLPRLHRHLTYQGVDNSMFVTQWFVTLFTNCFPFEMVTRVWDCFLSEGLKVLYRVQLAILAIHEKELLKRDFEAILDYVKRIPPSLDVEELMALAFRLPLTRKEIAHCEAEFARQNPSLSDDLQG